MLMSFIYLDDLSSNASTLVFIYSVIYVIIRLSNSSVSLVCGDSGAELCEHGQEWGRLKELKNHSNVEPTYLTVRDIL